MLVATRDDEPRLGEGHRDRYHDGGQFSPGLPPRSHLLRLTGLVQFFGSLVGIPLALASGYSLYHSNFSPEATCQSLRANIIGMLDKKADASTLRMLVRRDVMTFERECGAVDADAVAAFRGLLAADPKAGAAVAEPAKAAPAAKAQVQPQMPQARAKVETPHKTLPAPAAVATRDTKRDLAPHNRREAIAEKPSVEKAAAEKPAEPTKPAETAATEKAAAEKAAAHPAETAAAAEPAAVDAKWIADVREALRESAARSEASQKASATALPAMAAPLPAPIAIPAPANPAPVQVSADRDGASQPAASQDDDDHPVPPAPIPEPNADR